MRITALLALSFSLNAVAVDKPASDVKVWLESSLQRVFPNSTPGTKTELTLTAARNYTVSFQAVARNMTEQRMTIACAVSGAPDLRVQVRRVGYVPMIHYNTNVPAEEQDGMGHIPGMIPDPLFPEQSASVGPFENQSFWITVRVPAGVEPSTKSLSIRLIGEEKKGNQTQRRVLGDLTARVEVRSLTLQPRHNFPVTHWWYPDAIYDLHKAEPFGEDWWKLADKYVRDMVSHGSNMVVVPLFHIRPELVPRPPQLLKVTQPAPGQYRFDFSGARRFVRMAKAAGVEYWEFPHLWGPSWTVHKGIQNPVNVYTQDGDKYTLLWPVGTHGAAPVWIGFLKQFLPELHKFVVEENILDRSYFHISDEPGGDEHFQHYQRNRALLKELAPWMKVIDALSEVRYGKEGVTDIPVPILPAAQKYIEAGIPHWVYFCTSPRGKYLNRLYDTPLPKIRMAGFLLYKMGANGFLHWGYNYWYKMSTGIPIDPFEEAAMSAWPGIPYGDTFVVYPGLDGPIDSIRWEVFAEGLQDYALLQTLGVPRESTLIAEVKSYSEFPKSEAWIDQTLQGLLSK